MRRLSVLLVFVATAVAVLVGPAASAAGYDTGAEGVFINGVNQARSEVGLGGLRVSSDLTAIARRHAAEMASRGSIYHNASLGSEVSSWQAIAENVGDGTSAAYVNNLFRQSAPHHKNMVDARWVDMGIGVVWAGDHLYVTEVFRQPAGAAAAPAPAPAPTRAAPPQPRAPRRAPAPKPPAPAPAPAPAPVAAPAPPPAPPKPTVTSLRVVSPTGVADTSSPVIIRTIADRRPAPTSTPARRPAPVEVGALVLLVAVTGLLARDALALGLRGRQLASSAA